MNLSQFQFNLPPELIAQNPAVPRDSARLFVYDRLSEKITHAKVSDLPAFLPEKTILVANNSRVRKARLLATTETGKKIELLVLEMLEERTYRCLVGGHGLKAGTRINAPFSATVLGKDDLPGMTCFRICFEGDIDSEDLFERFGQVPLPPYITNSQAQDDQYQTVYANLLGSAAAPTAGLHFTPELLERLRNSELDWTEVTLHVGLGTFLPLRQEVIEENHLHTETTNVPEETANLINHNPERPVLAIGTTSTRTLESHSSNGLQAGETDTDMFIYPGYQFQTVNALLTNFHLPHSSLLLLVAAFIGNRPDNSSLLLEPEEMPARLMRLYDEAISQHYRFFSFGDAMLIL